MVAAVRYEVALDSPVLMWQGGILLRRAISEARSFLVTVHGFRPNGAAVEQVGRTWYRSAKLEADFHYLATAAAGDLVVMPPVKHSETVNRLELVVRPFATRTDPAPIVSTLCFQDLDPLDSDAPVVISTHTPVVIDV